jgi:hypothetical protein
MGFFDDCCKAESAKGFDAGPELDEAGPKLNDDCGEGLLVLDSKEFEALLKGLDCWVP